MSGTPLFVAMGTLGSWERLNVTRLRTASGSESGIPQRKSENLSKNEASRLGWRHFATRNRDPQAKYGDPKTADNVPGSAERHPVTTDHNPRAADRDPSAEDRDPKETYLDTEVSYPDPKAPYLDPGRGGL